MSIDVQWTSDDGVFPDMENGLALIHKVGGQATFMNLNWEDIDSVISLLIAHRELKNAKERVSDKEESHMSYGGTA